MEKEILLEETLRRIIRDSEDCQMSCPEEKSCVNFKDLSVGCETCWMEYLANETKEAMEQSAAGVEYGSMETFKKR
jgi:hypothetical protein